MFAASRHPSHPTLRSKPGVCMKKKRAHRKGPERRSRTFSWLPNLAESVLRGSASLCPCGNGKNRGTPRHSRLKYTLADWLASVMQGPVGLAFGSKKASWPIRKWLRICHKTPKDSLGIDACGLLQCNRQCILQSLPRGEQGG